MKLEMISATCPSLSSNPMIQKSESSAYYDSNQAPVKNIIYAVQNRLPSFGDNRSCDDPSLVKKRDDQNIPSQFPQNDVHKPAQGVPFPEIRKSESILVNGGVSNQVPVRNIINAVQNRLPSFGDNRSCDDPSLVEKRDPENIPSQFPQNEVHKPTQGQASLRVVDYEEFFPSGDNSAAAPIVEWEFCEANPGNKWTGLPPLKSRKPVAAKKKVIILAPVVFKKKTEKTVLQRIKEQITKGNHQFHNYDQLKLSSYGSVIPVYGKKS